MEADFFGSPLGRVLYGYWKRTWKVIRIYIYIMYIHIHVHYRGSALNPRSCSFDCRPQLSEKHAVLLVISVKPRRKLDSPHGS